MLVGRGRLSLDTQPEDWRRDLVDNGLIELALTGPIAVRAAELGGLFDDQANQFIVATALLHGAELVTANDKILAWRHPLVRYDASK